MVWSGSVSGGFGFGFGGKLVGEWFDGKTRLVRAGGWFGGKTGSRKWSGARLEQGSEVLAGGI